MTFDDGDGRWSAAPHGPTSSHRPSSAYKDANVRLAIGPAIENGFYYDFDIDRQLTEADLADIEKEMKKIVKENLKLERKESAHEGVPVLFEERARPTGRAHQRSAGRREDHDVHAGRVHGPLRWPARRLSTGKVKALKLMSIAGAYWRGDEHNKMLQRIYGTAFEKQADLDAYLHMLEEAKKRDLRKLGKQLDLFSLHEEGRASRSSIERRGRPQ